MTSKQVVKLLRAHGWERKTQKGSHLQMHHARRKGKVTVPMHGGDIPPERFKVFLNKPVYDNSVPGD